MSSAFAGLGLPADLGAALAHEGIIDPFPIQSLTIPDALAGRDICGKAKTGSGKTLAFGLPMLTRVGKSEPTRPRGLVLVPTRELANQVTKALQPLGKVLDRRVRAVYGGVAMDPQVEALRKGVDIVVGTPGRLIDLIERGELSVAAVEVLVVDEADRMADMGFMPQVQKILYRIELPHQTMLFSATLDGAVKRLVDRYMTDPVNHEVFEDEPTVNEMEHRFLLRPPDGQGEGGRVDRRGCRPHARVLPHEARCRPTGHAAPSRERACARHSRRPAPRCSRAARSPTS